jgi:phosphoribosylaminoimidazole carboxylase PurE protein
MPKKSKVVGGTPRVAILMGSDSDLPQMVRCAQVLREYGIPFEAQVLSAHRSPEETRRFAARAQGRGLRVIVAGAGGSAHLAGVVAAHTPLPVIGVPLEGSPLKGLDALLSTVQMPPGIPVATVGIGAAGAANAAHLAALILALGDADLRRRVQQRRQRMAREVRARSAGLSRKLEEQLRSA